MGGKSAYDALFGPLLRGKFGERAPDIAMTWLWSRFHERSLSLGYLRGGFQQLYDALGQRLESLGGSCCSARAFGRSPPVTMESPSKPMARSINSVKCW